LPDGPPPLPLPREEGSSHSSSGVVNESSGRPGFAVSEFNLGDVRWGEVLPFELGFVNKSDRRIEIVRVTANCDCTFVDYPSDATLEAGERVFLTGYVDAGRNPGSRTRMIDVELADGSISRAGLRYSVTGTYTIQPELVDFGCVSADDEIETDIRIEFFEPGVRLDGAPLADANWITCEVTVDEPTNAILVARVHVVHLVPGLNTARIVVNTTDPVRPNTALLAKAILRSNITDATSHALLGADVVGTGEIELRNVAGARTREASSLDIHVADGRSASILVSILPEEH
jgi:hypothetical protein